MVMKAYSGKHLENKTFDETKIEDAKKLLAPEGKQLLFCIERNTNANQVNYFMNVKDGAVEQKDPVGVEWIMWHKNAKGEVRESLNFVENNTAYGITAKAAGDDYSLVVISLKKVPMQIVLDPKTKEWVAIVEIDGKKARLLRVYVFTVSSWGMPKVEYTDFMVQFEGSDKVECKRMCV